MPSDFYYEALRVGFTKIQAEFLDENLAKYPHSHTVEEIEGLDDYVDESVENIVEAMPEDDTEMD